MFFERNPVYPLANSASASFSERGQVFWRKAVCTNMESNCVKLTLKNSSTEAVVWQRLCCRTYLGEEIYVFSPLSPRVLPNLTSPRKIFEQLLPKRPDSKLSQFLAKADTKRLLY